VKYIKVDRENKKKVKLDVKTNIISTNTIAYAISVRSSEFKDCKQSATESANKITYEIAEIG
jgi:hypothetical protein